MTRNNVPFPSDPNLLVLLSLVRQSRHGWSMIQDIQQFSGQKLGPGTLYGAITRLEQKGWIAPSRSDDPRRQPYQITGLGREVLAEQIDRLGRIVKTAADRIREGSAGEALL